MPQRVGVVYGTRPEAIKVAPLALALEADDDFELVLISTGQHREVLYEIGHFFGLRPHHDVAIMRPGQNLSAISSRVISEISEIFRSESLDRVVVQGDTSTAFAAAYAAACERIPVAHLEAGLRTGNRREPFPEEINRRLISQVADMHFAPTEDAARNLFAEGISPDDVWVTGNTVIDALRLTLDRPVRFRDPELARALDGDRVVLLTMHRRESWGEPIHRVATAVARLCAGNPCLRVVVPLHPNPVVADVFREVLGQTDQVLLCEALRYSEFVAVMDRAELVLTDSGGVQEEAPSLGTPVLVLRDRTERPEGIAAGCARLVGTDPELIEYEVNRLLSDPIAYEAMRRPGITCYGDGKAAQRCLEVLRDIQKGTP
ncbi:non-hydrolyzing UDP-N-acetylglucosamine 2-epimerase [Streptomyces sp. SP17KL33]|uniref:non-hydrolyzing UDP-N-acetylglucosamine 2-epimerase n=1 Tax=Streptomyces sp. SP17KL33 TaxID=3002534 RepID=UPI002E77E39E|nr:UDP-N-acetylglucosamine 2-epimerase (non-hydrolyzing) [Streptomyces sp. SP17KL33]MEE1831712.1 UDP-N-acetylglucosamine 2-epimerase (non-hydrolyzing) [Streptomyces sp. SP17KL33]